MGTYDQQTRSLEFPLTFTSTRRHCKAWNTCKMKCYIILTVIVALTVSHAEEVEIVETREKCHHTPTGPVCDKEVLKREICTNGVCKKVSADFEVVETREKCHPTPTGPICDKEVLKREMCKEGPGPLGPRCKKVEEDVHEIVETREMPPHSHGSTMRQRGPEKGNLYKWSWLRWSRFHWSWFHWSWFCWCLQES